MEAIPQLPSFSVAVMTLVHNGLRDIRTLTPTIFKLLPDLSSDVKNLSTKYVQIS